MGLAEILQWIQYGRKTGTVVFEKTGVVKKVFIEEGLIISASSNDPREYLGQILVCFGDLTEEQLTQAFQIQKKAKKLLGKVLKEDFGIPEKQILKSLQVKIEETIYGIFLWEDGKFIYTEGIAGLQQHDRLKTAISIDQVIFEGARRVDEWREFRKQFPTDDVIFVVKKGKEKLDLALSKDPIISKIFENVTGDKNVQRILLDTHAPDYRGYEALGKLYLGGYLDAKKATRSQKKEVVRDLQSDLLRAAELYKSKKYDEAYDLVEIFLASRPENEEAQTLFRVVREAFIASLYNICEANSVPTMIGDFNNLNEEVYSSKEGYLASRINGDWDVKSLIMISPMGELESLRILKRLHDAGMVEFRSN
ncbi:MAG: hypothetical protein COV44_01400 [Deltaproteobacteria bacterium CG11_big_fil_rev_8_21_14_0_20_45_16]|nr:MAG: hypothetical protein COV44_01400 [Deltaproteobacteria bacterium CG11_big_fil_rev_8_21_14_0_20_45_16]